MRKYHQLTSRERYVLSALRKQGYSQAEIARILARDRSTISREVRRNSQDRTGRVYRPALADDLGHWEVDTVLGSTKPCIVTLVERKIGYLIIGKLRNRTVAELNRVTIQLINSAPVPIHTITADNGTEFHGYKMIEAETGVLFYFANPHHSWERGTNENTNGLIRQYLPKRRSLANVTQAQCHRIADKLNNRPRKRLDFRTPLESYELLCA